MTAAIDANADLDLPADETIDDLRARFAELSEPSPQPDGFRAIDSFTADEVDFQSNAWIVRLCEIQRWLNLDSELDPEQPPARVARALFEQIAPRDTSGLFESTDDLVHLTETGAARLQARVDRASELRNEFIFNVDDEEMPVRRATEIWREAWDNEPEDEPEPYDFRATVDTWGIAEFRELAKTNQIDLDPSYQRGFVWSTSDSQKLVSSVLLGIPLPSVILTKAGSDDSYQIVDGKQRLTAILRFTGDHPDGRKFAESQEGGLDLFDTNFRKFARRNGLKPREHADNSLPFRVGKYPSTHPLSPLSGKYFSEIRNTKIEVGGTTATVDSMFRIVRKIPVIIYQHTRLKDIHYVFQLYNRQGKQLNAEELRNASYHELDLTKLLLVLSGDRRDFALARYLPSSVREHADDVERVLTSHNFGTARFKRTKVISWATAVLLKYPGREDSDHLVYPSTAKHINSLLDAIQDPSEGRPQRKLAEPAVLSQLAETLQRAVIAHADALDAWDPQFRNKKGNDAKWEELPLVASLAATFLLCVAGKEHELSDRLETIRTLTRSLKLPTKTQNRTQWEFIAASVVELLRALDTDEASLSDRLSRRFGYSCIPVFTRMAAARSPIPS